MSGMDTLSLLSFAMLIMLANASKLCDICSCFQYEEDNMWISCKGDQLKIDFEEIEWPKTESGYFKAFFNNISLHYLPKIRMGDSKVVSLNLDGNAIRTIQSAPFEYFSHLQSISVANNRITELNKDFLKSQKNLIELNLSNNSLSTIDAQMFENLEKLEELNISYNFLTKLSAEFLEATRSVQTMHLENNKIYAIDNGYDKIDYNLRKFHLAFNQFTVITSSMFEKLIKLQMIDLSDNKIANIDENAFETLTSLKLLDLSNNNLKRIVLRLPDSIELLSINGNNLLSWPFLNTPKNLTELELNNNNLEYIFPKDKEVIRNLRVLDISNNLIYSLPNIQFLQLEKLDLSFNFFKTIPTNLNSITPFLRDLILDGNHIETIEFQEKTILGSISLSQMPSLKKIQAGAFENLRGSHLTKDGAGMCIDVKISDNEFLTEIDEDAFEGLKMCYLDLSNNQLVKIPKETNWTDIDFGINLQGNPLSCGCEDQWMIDSILHSLYYSETLQPLLLELRCNSPEELNGKRFVSFLNHKDPFCNPNDYGVEKSAQMKIQESNFGGFFIDTSSSPSSNYNENKLNLAPFSLGFIIIVSLCSVILVLFIIVGVKWQRDQNRKLTRRNRLYYDEY